MDPKLPAVHGIGFNADYWNFGLRLVDMDRGEDEEELR